MQGRCDDIRQNAGPGRRKSTLSAGQAVQVPELESRPVIIFLDDEPTHLEQGLYVAVEAAQAAAMVPPGIKPFFLPPAQGQAQQGQQRAQVLLSAIRARRLPLLELPGPVIVLLGLVIGPAGLIRQGQLARPFQEDP